MRLTNVELALKELRQPQPQPPKTKKWKKLIKNTEPKQEQVRDITGVYMWGQAQSAAYVSLKAMHNGSGSGICSCRGSDSGSDSDSDRGTGTGPGSDRDSARDNKKYNGEAKDVTIKTGGMKKGTPLYKETCRIYKQMQQTR